MLLRKTKKGVGLVRLHALTDDQLEEWRLARMESGREKYHHIDHKRNLMVDIVEEAMDVLNILRRFAEHAGIHNKDTPGLDDIYIDIEFAARWIIKSARSMSNHMDDIDDSEGGYRVWWSEQTKEETSERADICKTCKDNDVCDLMRALDEDKKCLRLKKKTLLKEGLDSLKKYFDMERMKIGG